MFRDGVDGRAAARNVEVVLGRRHEVSTRDLAPILLIDVTVEDDYLWFLLLHPSLKMPYSPADKGLSIGVSIYQVGQPRVFAVEPMLCRR